MTPEQLYLENLGTIERVAAFVARRSHLNADEAAEFTQEVRVRLLEDDYAIIRKFEGRSSFSTYLTTVIMRLHHQYRVEQWGKWRPSAEAKRLGDKAITLERLLSRDGYSFAEAVKILTTPACGRYSEAELESIYVRLPARAPRPTLVSDDAVPEGATSVEPDAEERAESRERACAARTAARALDELLQSMEAEDRLILQMRFWDGMTVPDIARRIRLDQKKIYKRLDKLFVIMRRGLESAGVSRDEIARLLTSGDQEIHLDVLSLPAPEIAAMRPSQQTGGEEVRGSEGRVR